MFSSVGHINNPKRYKLNDNNYEYLVILKANRPIDIVHIMIYTLFSYINVYLIIFYLSTFIL